MNYYSELDRIMKQDFGGRGLLASLPPSPIKETADSLFSATRVFLLTGFPVRKPDESFMGETDGPSGTANLAAAFAALGCGVTVITDSPSYGLLQAALQVRAPHAALFQLPDSDPAGFIRQLFSDFRPSHLITLERPGKAEDGHYYNMRGQIIDDMITDSDSFFPIAREHGVTVVSIGDGGNEMGMGTFRRFIEQDVPFGARICAAQSADLTLASGVSNWWGFGIASLLSIKSGKNLLPTPEEETLLLQRVVEAGGIDGATKESAMTVDSLPLSVHLDILRQTTELTEAFFTGQDNG